MSLRLSGASLTARLPNITLSSRCLPPRASQFPLGRCPRPPWPPTRPASQWGPSNPRYTRFQNAQGLYQLWQTSPVFRYGVGAAGVSSGAFYYANLERVPVSGRLRFNCVSATYEEQQAKQDLQQITQQFQGRVLPSNHPDSMLVNRVLKRLIAASGMEDLDWEVKVINAPEQENAFVMPG